MNQSNFFYVDDPTVDLMDNGSAIVGWVNQTEKDIFIQRINSDNQKSEKTPINVSRTPGVFSWFPTIETSHEPGSEYSSIHVAWQEIVFSGGSHGGEIFYSYSGPDTYSFRRPVNLSSSKAGDGKGRLTKKSWDNGSLDMKRTEDGTIYVAWTEYQGKLWLRYREPGKRFSEPILIHGTREKKPARGPSIAVGSSGLHLAWVVGEDSHSNLYYQNRTLRGKMFKSPKQILTGQGHADSPKIAVDNSSILHLAYGYAKNPPPFGNNMSRDVSENYEIQYARMEPQEESFSGPVTISSSFSEPFVGSNFPSLGVTDAGNPLVVWELYRADQKYSQGLGVNFSKNGGKSFEQASIIPGSRPPNPGFNGSQQGKLMGKISLNENGNLAVVNSTFQYREQSSIRLLRGQILSDSRNTEK